MTLNTKPHADPLPSFVHSFYINKTKMGPEELRIACSWRSGGGERLKRKRNTRGKKIEGPIFSLVNFSPAPHHLNAWNSEWKVER